jgi:2-isopropylmalate synthase
VSRQKAASVSAEHITIFDTTLRDGEQAPGCSMYLEEKLRMARQLDRLGVDVIEAGFPVASEGDFEAVRAVAREVRRPRIAALARAHREDISRAWQAVERAAHPRIHTFLATSDIHLQHKLKISRAQCLEQTRTAVSYAKSLCNDVEFSPEDATRSDPDFLVSVLQEAVDTGATTLNIPDTVGYTIPSEYAQLIRTIRERVRGIERAVISVHCHNDLGLAVANSLAAVAEGARQVECTVNGIGERAGNAALEEVVMALRVRADRLPYQTRIAGQEIIPSSRLLSELIGFTVQPNKAIVGANAFAHEAGIHQHGVLSNPLCYEIMTPESVGLEANRIVLGKHSGRHALSLRYAELGCQLSREQLNAVYQRFTALADRKKNIYDLDLIGLLPAEMRATTRRKASHGAAPESERLRSSTAAAGAR